MTPDPLVAELRDRREKAGLTQRQLADAMHCVQSHVSMLEAGRTDLQLDTLRRWAAALGVQPAWVPLAYETAPAAEFPAGNGAPSGYPSPPDAPASAPVEVGSDLDLVRLGRFDEGHIRPVRAHNAVARTLDVAERTVEKAREAVVNGWVSRLRPLSDSSEYTCDWGSCNEVAHSERFDGSQWLSVCPQHETSTDSALPVASPVERGPAHDPPPS